MPTGITSITNKYNIFSVGVAAVDNSIKLKIISYYTKVYFKISSIMQEIQFVNRIQARGGVEVNGFSGAINDLIAIQEGDVFTFPTKMKVYEEPIANSNNVVQFTLVTLENGDVAPFYPSALTKSRTVVDEVGNSRGRIYATGTMVDAYKQYGTVDEGMKQFAGKTAKLTSYKQYQVRPIGNQRPIEGKSYVETGIGQWDLVD